MYWLKYQLYRHISGYLNIGDILKYRRNTDLCIYIVSHLVSSASASASASRRVTSAFAHIALNWYNIGRHSYRTYLTAGTSKTRLHMLASHHFLSMSARVACVSHVSHVSLAHVSVSYIIYT